MQINNDGRIITDELSVHDFLECITPFYNNDHGVEIRTNLFHDDRDPEEQDSISLFASWHSKASAMPFHDENVIAKFYCSTIDEFMLTFGINDAVGINSITPSRLFDLYREGKAEIECDVSHLYDCYSLYFSLGSSNAPKVRRFDEIAIDDFSNEDTVSILLDSPDQFIQYTRQYYKLDDMPVSEGEKLECGIYYYLDKADAIFRNKCGVEFSHDGLEPGIKDNEYSVSIYASWPSEDDDPTGLSAVYEGFDVSVLIKTFGITSPDGLEKITPLQLQNLYYQGKACIYCWLDDEEVSLYFRLKEDGSIMASEYYLGNDSQERVFEVHGLLETPEQFIDYTRQYYRYVRLFK